MRVEDRSVGVEEWEEGRVGGRKDTRASTKTASNKDCEHEGENIYEGKKKKEAFI